MTIKVKLMNKNAKVPQRQLQSAGYDLFACADATLCEGEATKVYIGVAIAIPEGYVGLVKPRSGLAFQESVDAMAGVIDQDYRGEIKCLLTLHSVSRARGYDTYEIKKGDRIAQLVMVPCLQNSMEVVDTLPTTERGENGYGSTGK